MIVSSGSLGPAFAVNVMSGPRVLYILQSPRDRFALRPRPVVSLGEGFTITFREKKMSNSLEINGTELTINGTTYVPKDSLVDQAAETVAGMPYVIVRTYTAGVFAGYLESREGKEVILRRARRLWQWAGAASLSQLAKLGTSLPGKCKFPCEVDSVILTESIEILSVTKVAHESINEVKIWTA